MSPRFRLALLGTAVLLIVAAVALVVVHDDDGNTAVSAGDSPTTTFDEPTTTIITTTTVAPLAPTTTTTAAVPTTTTTTAPPPVRYPTGPADPIEIANVYVVATADGVPHRISHGDASLDRPTWSVDGRRVLYAGGKIVSVDPDGKNLKTHSLPGAIEMPRWSAKGQLAAVALENGNTYYLAVSQPNGSVRTIKDVGPVSGVTWSPDGTRLAFVAGNRVWTANADTTGGRALTPAGGKAYKWILWSPDGARIAFYESQQVKVMNADGTNLHSVAPVSASAFAWSPDGTRLVVGGPEDQGDALGIVSAAGGAVQQLGVSGFSPSWSPDGRTIAYRPQGKADVALIAPDGSGKRILLAQPADTFFGDGLAWSPDSTHLLVNTGGGGEGGPSPPQ